MKKMAILLITLAVFVSSASVALAEITLQINGVNIPLVGNNGKLLAIEEIDGNIYVPIECFLNALGLSYTISEESVSVTYSLSDNNADVDEYANLLPEEKTFVDLLMEKASSFKNPSTITLKSMLYVGPSGVDSQIFVVNISAQNSFGGYTSEYYMILYDGSVALWRDTTAEKVAELMATADGIEQPDFDYGRINGAIRQKISELGY